MICFFVLFFFFQFSCTHKKKKAFPRFFTDGEERIQRFSWQNCFHQFSSHRRDQILKHWHGLFLLHNESFYFSYVRYNLLTWVLLPEGWSDPQACSRSPAPWPDGRWNQGAGLPSCKQVGQFPRSLQSSQEVTETLTSCYIWVRSI